MTNLRLPQMLWRGRLQQVCHNSGGRRRPCHRDTSKLRLRRLRSIGTIGRSLSPIMDHHKEPLSTLCVRGLDRSGQSLSVTPICQQTILAPYSTCWNPILIAMAGTIAMCFHVPSGGRSTRPFYLLIMFMSDGVPMPPCGSSTTLIHIWIIFTFTGWPNPRVRPLIVRAPRIGESSYRFGRSSYTREAGSSW